MTDRPRGPFRADHVGSLLRPPQLLELRKRAERGEVTQSDLRAEEDASIAAIVKMQESVGLQSITDGEFRRFSFHGDFISKIDGVEFKFVPESQGAPFVAVTNAKLRWPEGGIEVDNFAYVHSLTRRTVKQTLPSPTMSHFRGGREAIDCDVYPELSEFFDDLAAVYRHEVAALGAAGCRYLQFDDTNFAYLCDDRHRQAAEQRGEDLQQLPHDYARLINASIRERPADMSVCIHLCRGNAHSRWFASGGYEPVAEILFNELDVDGFFLEYDDERSGTFEPLRFVPNDKKVVLGLVTSKRGELEDKHEIEQRIDSASRYIELGQLCLSPQCGFASAAGGNLLSTDEQRRKLELVVEVASKVWGSSACA